MAEGQDASEIDVRSGVPVVRLRCAGTWQRYKVEACFSRDDAWVLSGSEDGRVVVWDLVEATILGQPRAHKGPVRRCAHQIESNLCCTEV